MLSPSRLQRHSQSIASHGVAAAPARSTDRANTEPVHSSASSIPDPIQPHKTVDTWAKRVSIELLAHNSRRFRGQSRSGQMLSLCSRPHGEVWHLGIYRQQSHTTHKAQSSLRLGSPCGSTDNQGGHRDYNFHWFPAVLVSNADCY
ncbi:unnamed protein product [Zymoseptoria tritici ST99CH_3D7]|uniref:Uncharacterized protein n=1 Tax=Zymoseptoria tritici (strain ST99CH_3D7) TaxID=1276538 RepID=A0A1X7RZ12_ZYMT9|nr:unnamed protein product [Zymoseptoria tritici ST99CH_3D7]